MRSSDGGRTVRPPCNCIVCVSVCGVCVAQHGRPVTLSLWGVEPSRGGRVGRPGRTAVAVRQLPWHSIAASKTRPCTVQGGAGTRDSSRVQGPTQRLRARSQSQVVSGQVRSPERERARASEQATERKRERERQRESECGLTVRCVRVLEPEPDASSLRKSSLSVR